MFRVQGAFLSHIRPAFLLDIQEFKHWCSLQVEFFRLRLHYVLYVSVLYTNEIEWMNGWTFTHTFINSSALTVKWGRNQFRLQLCWLWVSEQTILDRCPTTNLQGGKSNSLSSLILTDFQSHHWLFLCTCPGAGVVSCVTEQHEH